MPIARNAQRFLAGGDTELELLQPVSRRVVGVGKRAIGDP